MELDADIQTSGDAFQHAETCLSQPTRALCEGKEPKHFWLVGGTIKDIKPSKVTKCISIEKSTLSTLIEEVQRQLKLHTNAQKASGEVESVFIFFAVGIFDLAPDATPVSLLKNLNELVDRERQLREELSFYDGTVSNICFTTTYPPSMDAMGAGVFVRHAQQFVDLAFRWYNRWTLIVNNCNGSGICRLDKPFQCNGGRYKLKVGQLADDGIMPNANTAKTFANFVDKCIVKLQEMWANKESFKLEKSDKLLLKKSWHAVKQAEKVYLDALSGSSVTSFKLVSMPFVSTKSEGTLADKDQEQSTSNKKCSSPIHISSVVVKSSQMVEIEKDSADNNVDFSADVQIKEDADKPEKKESFKISNNLDGQHCETSNISKKTVQKIVGDEIETDLDSEGEKDLHLFQVAKGIVTLCPAHIQSKALRLLDEFKIQEKKIQEKRLEQDRLRVANFQERMRTIKNNSRSQMGSLLKKDENVEKSVKSQTSSKQQSGLSNNKNRIQKPQQQTTSVLPQTQQQKPLDYKNLSQQNKHWQQPQSLPVSQQQIGTSTIVNQSQQSGYIPSPQQPYSVQQVPMRKQSQPTIQTQGQYGYQQPSNLQSDYSQQQSTQSSTLGQSQQTLSGYQYSLEQDNRSATQYTDYQQPTQTQQMYPQYGYEYDIQSAVNTNSATTQLHNTNIGYADGSQPYNTTHVGYPNDAHAHTTHVGYGNDSQAHNTNVRYVDGTQAHTTLVSYADSSQPHATHVGYANGGQAHTTNVRYVDGTQPHTTRVGYGNSAQQHTTHVGCAYGTNNTTLTNAQQPHMQVPEATEVFWEAVKKYYDNSKASASKPVLPSAS